MRRARAAAAAALALALALAAGGCKPTSLTPLGLGNRGTDDSLGVHSGAWKGPNSSGGTVSFQVVSEEVKSVSVVHVSGSCTKPLPPPVEDLPAVIEGDSFTYDVALDPQGHLVVGGTFTSAGTVTGEYTFDSIAATFDCPTAGSGTFTATKQATLNAQEARP